MKYREAFGKKLSVIAFGADRISTKDVSAANEFLDTYVSYGGNFIDTARIYGFGDCEKALGNWLVNKDNRKKVFLGTKGGHPDPATMHTGRLDKKSLEYDMQKSLEALKVDCVDMYYLHRDDEERPVGDILETLNLFIQNGFTKRIGVSNWRAGRIASANEYAKDHGLEGFTADQPQFSLAKQVFCGDDTLVTMDKELYGYHVRTGMTCVCYTSQAKGYFTKLQEKKPLSDNVRRMFDCEENREIFEKIKTSGSDACAVSLSYVTDRPYPSFAIVGASSTEQLVQTLLSTDKEITGLNVTGLRKI